MKSPFMRYLLSSMCAGTIAAAVVWFSAAALAQVPPASGQAYTPSRTHDGQPDLQGIWKTTSRAAYDLLDHHASHGVAPGPGVVDGNEIPYQPWALAKRNENYASRATADPLNSCYRPGVPRITYLDFPFQIFQSEKYIAILYEWSHIYRIIHIDETPFWDGIEFWMGDSRGHWEGNTLVVEVRNQNDKTWFDMAGNFHSEALHVVERYTRVDPDTMRYEVTVEDPKVFIRPWKMAMTLSRQNQQRLFEYECQAEAEEARGEFNRQPTWYPGPGTPGTHEMSRPYADISRPVRPVPQATEALLRTGDGKPKLQGAWGGTSQGASWGLEDHEPRFGFPGGKAIVIDPPDRKLPTLPWTDAEEQRRLRDDFAHEDPTAHCFVAGLPRAHYAGGGLQILQTADAIVMIYGRWNYRVIPLDGRKHLPDSVRLWMGDSIGHWEGDTLVVDTTNFNGKSWLDEVGEVITHAQHVVERFTMVAPNRMEYEATIDDPIAYSRPWTIAFTYNRSRDEAYLEEACLEGNQALKLMKGAAEKARQPQQ
jgi:hypothetical protein